MPKVKDKTNAKRQRAFQARRQEHGRKVKQALDTMPPEWADDCKISASPPGPKDKGPRVNWDIGPKTNALILAHAKSHGVTLDDVLYGIGLQLFDRRPKLRKALMSAKIVVSEAEG